MLLKGAVMQPYIYPDQLSDLARSQGSAPNSAFRQTFDFIVRLMSVPAGPAVSWATSAKPNRMGLVH